MSAYSLDLRHKILSAWQNKENTQRGLAKRFKVSLSFVRDFLRRYRETKEIAARPQVIKPLFPHKGSSGFEGISRTNGNRKPVWAMITA